MALRRTMMRLCFCFFDVFNVGSVVDSRLAEKTKGHQYLADDYLLQHSNKGQEKHRGRQAV